MPQPLTQLGKVLSAGVLFLSSMLLRTSGTQTLKFLGQPQFIAHVSLAAPPGRIIYTLLAINSTFRTPEGIRYSLVEHSYNPNLFELNALTGDLVNLQYLPLQSWVLQVEAEFGPESVQAELTVIAEPDYKVLPVFEKDRFSFTLSEYTPVGSLFGIVRAFSLDTASGAHSYAFISGNAGNDIMVNATTGVLTVARELDYETTPEYTLTIEYSHSVARARVSVEVTVLDENDNRPYFPVVMYEASVTESASIGSSVLTVSAVDLDSGLNQVIDYYIVETDSGFEIDSGSGEVFTAAEFDYEREREHRFTVMASDGGDPVLASTVIVVVRVANEDDECPVFQSTYLPITLSPEAIPDVGSVVATLQAVDPDNINNASYRLEPNQVIPQALGFNANTGEITLLDNSPNKSTLRVFASNDLSCESYVDVVINVGSTNTHSPQFSAPCEGTVLEGSPPETLVTTLRATDDDIGVYGDITYSFLGGSTEFSLDPHTGEVTVSEGVILDYESRKSYLIDAIARDLSNRQDYCLLNITVLDVNDNPPVFLDYPGFQVRTPENPTVGTFVAQLLAEDADSGSNAVIEYALQGSQEFAIDPASGVITVASATLVSEESYSLTLEASNPDASLPLSSAVSLTVVVTSDSIRFNQSLYSTTICENLQVSTPVLQVSTVDGTGTFFTLVSGSLYGSNSEDVFTINPTDGNIRVSSQTLPDYERLPNSKFIFSVTAQTLSDGTSVSSIATVEISVLDYDDNPPEFQSNSMGYTVSENSPIGSIVARVSATDPDSGTNGDITYSLNFDNGLFQITNSGEILSNMEIDAEEVTGSISLFVDANNPNPVNPDACSTNIRQSGLVVVTVSVLDLNDNAPSFAASTPHSISLSEDTPIHTTITTFSAIDEDINSDPSELYYSLTNGDNEDFMLRENGELVLVQSLDFEEMPTITLTIHVSDGINTNTTDLTINVLNIDDEPPVFTQPSYSITIMENLPLGTTVLEVSAGDVDTPSVSYWLSGRAEARLSITADSGVITVSGNIDREEFQDGIFTFAVVAEGGPLATANVTISITDENDCVPRFPSIDPFVVPENISPGPDGVHVGTVTAYDSDMGRNGEIVYVLRSGGEDGFTIIDPATGNITTYKKYDREATSSYTLVVEAMDMGEDVQLSTVTTFQVKIGDENDNIPYFPYPYMYTRVFENLVINTDIFKLLAVDLDEGTNAELTFTLLSSEPESGHIFTLDNATGVIRLAHTLDYENPLEISFTLTFSVADSIHERDTYATLEIEVLDRNDHTPVVEITGTPLGLAIPEDASEGTVILQMAASDGDSGTNSEIVFAISGGDPDGHFAVAATGNDAVVTIAHQLDYESKNSYNLVLQVCDRGTPALCTTLLYNITLIDIDDVVPSFSQSLYRGSVEENSAPVGSILQVLASDPDFGDSFVYAIESGNGDGRFSINSTTGVLSSTVELDREEQDTYTLVITAADQGGVPLSGTGTCVITVTDVDDNPPANDSQWNVVMLLLDGYLQDDQSIHYYFDDPDATSSFSGCSTVQSQNVGSFFSVDIAECQLLLNKGNIPENDYSIRVKKTNQAIFSTVDIAVEHISASDIPTESLVTVSLAMSSGSYLTTAYTSFPDTLSTMLKIDRQMATILSVQDGYHDSINTVDVSFLAKNGSNSYFDPAFTLQTLYTERERFQSMLGYELSALPTDPCSSEPCASQASCTATKTILESSVTATSPSFVLVTPVIELGFECECIPGTSGENCSINFNDCYSNPCHFGARCIDEVKGYRCQCPPGTSGEDCSSSPNGCSSNPCQNGADCRDIPGSHSCLCLPGYYGPECQYHYFRTAPTCDNSPCQNEGTCSPGRNSFTCLCPETYSGPLCQTESEPQACAGNPCYNGSSCTDSTSGPVCSCSVGFTGPLCRWQIDNCELEPCLNGGTCATGLYGSYQCYCLPPYTGENCGVFISGCDSSPCLNGGRCSDVSDSSDYICECRRGYSGDNCEYEVHPVNLCSEDNYPCFTGNCTYGLDSYTCSCPANYSGDNCEIGSPPMTQCDSNPCQHGGECSLMNSDNYICTCSPGFTGTHCQINIDDCSSNPCVNGVCRDGINGYECECESQQVTGYHCEVWCPTGLSGDFCQIPTTQCEQTLCENGGTCVEGTGGGDYHCICPPTHTGPACELENTCSAVECFNGGSCIGLEGGGFGCACNSGFDGANCQLVTVSFTASPSGATYRAYPSLHLSAKGRIEFEFSTVSSDGLLLYNTQLQSGKSMDFILVEVEGGRLAVGLSHGEDRVHLVPDLWVSDGQWHQVTINIIEKVYTWVVWLSVFNHAQFVHSMVWYTQCMFLMGSAVVSFCVPQIFRKYLTNVSNLVKPSFHTIHGSPGSLSNPTGCIS